MRTEHLKYFIEVARCHSVKIAAENLFVTQPTISIALKNLEEELGKPLFFRSKNGMFLTEIGKTVFNKAEELLIKENELYSLISKEHQDTNILSGHLLISSAPLIACSFLKEIVLDFLKKNSDVKLTIHDSCARKSIYSLENNHYDLCFFLSDESNFDEYNFKNTLEIKYLFSEKIYIVAKTNFNLGKHKSLSLEDVKKLPLVASHIKPEANYASIPETNSILITSNFELIKELVAQGTAISVLFNSLILQMQDIPELDIIPSKNPSEIKIYCAYKKTSEKKLLIDAFIEELRHHYHHYSITT